MTNKNLNSKPLEGLRVLDSTYVFALPYAGGHLADLGAEVIKIEGPSRPDVTRTGGYAGVFPENDHGEDWWNRPSTFNLINRGKNSVVLNMAEEEGRELFRELVKISDVVMENFTPRVMKGWGLDYPNLKKLNPNIIMISNTGYGHGDGPYSSYPSQATTAELSHGMANLTGYENGPPSKSGASFVDFLATWTAIFALGGALKYRNQTGKGQWIDIGMYQTGVMFISEYLLDSQLNGHEPERIGNKSPYRAPQNCYPTKGSDQWIAISVDSDEEWQTLCNIIGSDSTSELSKFPHLSDRIKNHDVIDQHITNWTSDKDKYDVMHLLQDNGIAAGPVINSKDIHYDEHYKARNFLEKVDYPEDRKMGTRLFLGRPYKLSKHPLHITKPAPKFGDHNEYYLKTILGIDDETYDSLYERGLIADVPGDREPSPTFDPAKRVESKNLADWDPDYKHNLGI
jgi:crotonobetainyl-CoA:carnitine CoA-transferase CaiB-like acyl-CoA transferase